MLPDGFELQSAGDTYRLLIHGRVIALAPSLDNGHCRVCLHTNHANHMRYVFPPSLEAGVRYLDRWVAKWEPELRKLYGQTPPRTH